MKLHDKRTFALLWLGCIGGSIAVLPYLSSITQISYPQIAVIILQALILWSLIIWLGLLLKDAIGFRLPFFEKTPSFNLKNDLFKPAILAGIFVGTLILLFDFFIFKSPMDIQAKTGTILYAFLASFYGAINEEVFSRLFFLSLCVWILTKIFRRKNRNSIIWASIILASFIFGAGHLPTAARIAPLTLTSTLRILFLNGIAGIVFGWLYWRKGLATAMLAHFTTDVIIHVVALLLLF